MQFINVSNPNDYLKTSNFSYPDPVLSRCNKCYCCLLLYKDIAGGKNILFIRNQKSFSLSHNFLPHFSLNKIKESIKQWKRIAVWRHCSKNLYLRWEVVLLILRWIKPSKVWENLCKKYIDSIKIFGSHNKIHQLMSI